MGRLQFVLAAFVALALASSQTLAANTCSIDGVEGTCIATSSCASLSGTSTANYCPDDPADVRCCTWGKCTAEGVAGSCTTVSACSEKGYTSTAGLCPGPTTVQCCTASSESRYASPCGVAKTKRAIVAAALAAHKSKKTIHYTQGAKRWSGIAQRKCPNTGDVPPHADCSSFVTWIYWSAFGNGPDILNGQNWKAGYTGTLRRHGRKVSWANAKPGDLIFYPGHVNILYTKSPKQVLNYGSEGAVKIRPLGRYDEIRSYI